MNPVEYTLNLQRVLVILGALGFVSLSLILVFLDPNQNSLYIWVFLSILLIFSTSLISLLAFWWFFSVRKEILSVNQVNNLVYQSLITGAIVVLLIVMNQTKQLNIWTAILVIITYIFYQLWINSE